MTSGLLSRTLTVILAGGRGERLYPLTRERAKPAVPFGGDHRIIDFTLSNCLNSNLRRIYILTQYKPESLHSLIRRRWRGSVKADELKFRWQSRGSLAFLRSTETQRSSALKRRFIFASSAAEDFSASFAFRNRSIRIESKRITTTVYFKSLPRLRSPKKPKTLPELRPKLEDQ